MIPLGVLGYPAAGAASTSLKEPSFWRRPKSPKLKRVQSPGKQKFGSSASILSSSVNCSNSLESSTSTFSLQKSPISPKTSNLSISPTRPKHVPILVPRYVPIVTPDSPCYSGGSSPSTACYSTRSECPSTSELLLPGRKASADSVKPKRRHVEIVIPAWAQPVHTLPDSPPSLPARSPLRVSISTASSNPLSPVKMSRQTPNASRSNTIDSSISAPSPDQLYSARHKVANTAYWSSAHSSQTSLHKLNTQESGPSDETPPSATSRTPVSQSAGPSPAIQQTAGTNSTAGLSGLVCNVHRTTGREPRPLVGATTTILGDKLYVFGGRRLSRSRPQLTADLYELDLVRRHWTKLEAKGDVPSPRYFHSVCGLGDTKLVCYGGMSPAPPPSGQSSTSLPSSGSQDPQPEVVVMSDIHIYDVPTRTWMNVPTSDAPQGRYAHCAAILPSSAVFSSATAPLSAIHHNP